MTELTNLTIVSPVNPLGYVQTDFEDYKDQLVDDFFLRELDVFTLTADTTLSTKSTLNFSVAIDSLLVPIPNGSEIALIDVLADVFFYAIVTAGGGTGVLTLTLDRPIDHIFPFAGGTPTLGKLVTSNLASAPGTKIAPLFYVAGGGTTPVYINRIIIVILCGGQPYGNLFGNATALVEGIILRHWNGVDYTIANWKSNGDIANFCYDVNIASGTVGPSGAWSVTARITFNGKDKHGSTIELETGQQLQAIVQESLVATGSISSVKIMAQGHKHPQ